MKLDGLRAHRQAAVFRTTARVIVFACTIAKAVQRIYPRPGAAQAPSAKFASTLAQTPTEIEMVTPPFVVAILKAPWRRGDAGPLPLSEMEGNRAPDASGGAPGASRAIFLLIWRSGQEREEARHEGEEAGQTSGQTRQTRRPLMSLAMSPAMSLAMSPPLLLWAILFGCFELSVRQGVAQNRFWKFP